METELKPRDDTSHSVSDDTGTPGINSPKLDEGLNQQQRAITSVQQAWRICEAIFNPQSERNRVNGVIAEKYNDGPPYDPKSIKDNGEGWRHNFSTGFLSSIINLVVPQPVQVIDTAQYLTAATLPHDKDKTGELSKRFQQGITKLIRMWDGWRTHIYGVSQEDVTFGYACAACIDDSEWRPRFFRQDEFGVPDGTGQHANEGQLLALKQSFLISDLLKLVGSDEKTISEDSDWYLDAVVESINSALPNNDQAGSNDKANTPRKFSDLVRDGNLGTSYDVGARTVDVYHLFSQEASGKVSHTVIGRQDGPKLLFDCFEQFEKMSDFVTFYTFEPGNGKLYGSKGLGRKLINIHLAVERARTRAADQMHLASMMWMKSDKGLAPIQFKIRHPFGLVSSDAIPMDQGIDANVEPFLKLDERLTAYAQAIAGAYIPDKMGENTRERTAHEAVIDAQRENQARQAYLQRFFGQFSDEVTMITRRACDPDTTDEDAKKFQQDMFKAGFTPELLAEIASLPATEVVHDLSNVQNQAVIETATALLASPYANKVACTRRATIARVGEDIANDLLLKDAIDPTEEAEQYRLQTLENAAIRVGETVNVSDRDNHKVHLANLTDDLKKSGSRIQQNVAGGAFPSPKVLDNINAAIVHGDAHIGKWEATAKATGNNDELGEIEQFKQFYAEATDMLHQLGTAMKEHAASAPPVPAPQPPSSPDTPILDPTKIKAVESIPYDKAPPQIQRQLEAMFGLQPAFGASKDNDWGGPSGGEPNPTGTTATDSLTQAPETAIAA